jgi:hypothetical protein
MFHLLDHVSTGDTSALVEIHTDWERFQSLASEFISPRTQIHTFQDAEEAARNFAASITSTLSMHEITLSELNEELSELYRLLQLIYKLRKLWRETRDPACKTALNWVIKTIRRMTRNKTKERWDTTMCNCEIKPQVIWPTARVLLNGDAPKASKVVHGYSGVKFLPYDKANAITD